MCIYSLVQDDGVRKAAWYPEAFCFGVLGKKGKSWLHPSHSLALQIVNSAKAENVAVCTALL